LKILNYFLIYSPLEIFAIIKYINSKTAKLSKREKIDIKVRQRISVLKKFVMFYLVAIQKIYNFQINKSPKNIESLKIIIACHL